MRNDTLEIPVRRDVWRRIFRLAARQGVDAVELTGNMLEGIVLACEIKEIEKNPTANFCEPATNAHQI